jgi:hypothetical protein
MTWRVRKSTNESRITWEQEHQLMGSEGEIKSLENELRHLTKDKTEAST